MMTDSYQKEKIYFRIIGLNADLLPSFESSVKNHAVKTAKYKNTDLLVVSVELAHDYNYYELSRFLVSNKISEQSYGIYISLVTERDNDGVHLPDYALRFYKLVGGNIDFSFVCTRS